MPDEWIPLQIGGRWTAMIIQCLDQRPCTFGELRRHLAPISAKVLSETLKSMEADDYLTRTPTATEVTYKITEHGRSLITLIHSARTWAATHHPDPEVRSSPVGLVEGRRKQRGRSSPCSRKRG